MNDVDMMRAQGKKSLRIYHILQQLIDKWRVKPVEKW